MVTMLKRIAKGMFSFGFIAAEARIWPLFQWLKDSCEETPSLEKAGGFVCPAEVALIGSAQK